MMCRRVYSVRDHRAVTRRLVSIVRDTRTVEETDSVQIVEWYDERVRLTDSPVARLNRAVAVVEAQGARAGLTALAQLVRSLARYAAVAATRTSVTVTS